MNLSTKSLLINMVLLVYYPLFSYAKDLSVIQDTTLSIAGIVTDEENNVIPGASVIIENTKMGAVTNGQGEFILKQVQSSQFIVAHSIGYETHREPVAGRTYIHFYLKKSSNKLDETIIIAYGSTTKRFNTGSISRITSKDISQQPISNPIGSLSGRVSGAVISQSSGLPGAQYDIQIRGKNSINSGNSPLYIINGIPYNGATLTKLPNSGITNQSPLNSINPNDIESIEILKDADATSIYGSRGANGVVMITTKTGKVGKTNFEANLYTGISKVGRTLNYLKTKDYLEMRREAYANDNYPVSTTGAYDLLLWDTTRNVDWKKMLIGNTAGLTDAQISISGGNKNTQFLMSGDYRHETTVFPGDLSDDRINVHLSISHSSENQKFKISSNTFLNHDNNRLIPIDLFLFVNTIPNAPYPLDPAGNLIWSEKGAEYYNPLSFIKQTYRAVTDNLVSNSLLQYKLLPNLNLKFNLGYTNTNLNQTILKPKNTQLPSINPISTSQFAKNEFRSWIIEPQLEYNTTINKSNIRLLLATSAQSDETNGILINASNYVNDVLIESISGASSISSSSNYSLYRYQSIFGRLNYTYDNKYIANISARKDGSSRFGPGKQYANFGSALFAWIWSDEDFIKKRIPLISYGKLRVGYGTTGNDKIGDYQYLDTWYTITGAFLAPYQGISSLSPLKLYNPNFAWEVNRETEGAIDIGLLENKLFFSINFYRNKSSNQLLNYTLPTQTGFSNVVQNSPATVLNTGWEFETSAQIMNRQAMKWSINANLTIPKNELISFPDLESSSYSNTYAIGQSIYIRKLLEYTGVDAVTGVYTFNGTAIPKDQVMVKDLQPRYYGGLQNQLSYRNLSISFLFQFIKQLGQNYLLGVSDAPGTKVNQPAEVLRRWQKNGDKTNIERYTVGTGMANTAYYNMRLYSSGSISDASYIRLKNISLSYQFPPTMMERIRVKNAQVYINIQNMITITNYRGNDPENQIGGLPPLKMYAAGIRLEI